MWRKLLFISHPWPIEGRLQHRSKQVVLILLRVPNAKATSFPFAPGAIFPAIPLPIIVYLCIKPKRNQRHNFSQCVSCVFFFFFFFVSLSQLFIHLLSLLRRNLKNAKREKEKEEEKRGRSRVCVYICLCIEQDVLLHTHAHTPSTFPPLFLLNFSFCPQNTHLLRYIQILDAHDCSTLSLLSSGYTHIRTKTHTHKQTDIENIQTLHVPPLFPLHPHSPPSHVHLSVHVCVRV